MSNIDETVTLELITHEPGTISITYQFRLPEHLKQFSVRFLDDWREVRANGFEINGENCTWTEENTQNPSIQVKFKVDDGPGLSDYVDAGDWAITRLPNRAFQWSYSQRGNSPSVETRASVSGEGVISDDTAVAYLGPHQKYTETVQSTGENFRLVVPDDAELRDSPANVLSALTHASDFLELGAVNDSVLAIAAPTDDQNWESKGSQRGDDGFWVRDDATTTETNETWVHEYVHTRQRFQRTNSIYWFVEGTADYFAALAAYERDSIDFREFCRFLTRSADTTAVLADPSTWSSQSTVYRQGRRTCAGLDLLIRSETGDDKTLMDVVKKVNEDILKTDEDQKLSNREIKQFVETVASERVDEWFDEYVHGRRAPSIADNPAAFGSTPNVSKPETPSQPEPDSSKTTTHRCPICDIETTAEFCPSCGHEFEDGGRTDTSDSRAGGRCPICDTTTSDRLCPGCGHDMAPRCPICNTIGGPDEDLCANCGEQLRK